MIDPRAPQDQIDAQKRPAPILSVVVTARNDDHGGGMLRRMQVFVDALLEQSRRFQLPIELIIVDWNPPGDRSRLHQVLSFNLKDTPATVRSIEVPEHIHLRLRHSDQLKLFQMIAKNAGIRRARGRFVLATNIDLLFTDELFRFISAGKLETGKFYRLDRYDVPSEIPHPAPVETQLRWCAENFFRINSKEGSRNRFKTKEPEPKVEVAPEESTLQREPAHCLQATAESTQPQRHFGQHILKVATLPLKLLLPKPIRKSLILSLPYGIVHWLTYRGIVRSVLPPVTVPPTVPLSVLPTAEHPSDSSKPIATLPPPDGEIIEDDAPPEFSLPLLHTNACGDFTLMSREDWFKLQGYAELEYFSWHLDSVLLYAANAMGMTEVVFDDSVRAYHIDHSGGWSEETNDSLFQRVARLGIRYLSNDDLVALARSMHVLGSGTLFNSANWGAADEHLFEVVIEGDQHISSDAAAPFSPSIHAANPA